MADTVQMGHHPMEGLEPTIPSGAHRKVGHADVGSQVHIVGLCPLHVGHARPRV